MTDTAEQTTHEPTFGLDIVTVSSFDDDRLVMYRNLKENSDLPHNTGRFIAEGPETIRLLLKSDLPVESMLLSTQQFEHLNADIISSGKNPKIFVGDKRFLADLVGFHYIRGTLACGLRPQERDIYWLRGYLQAKPAFSVLACDNITDVSNVGGMIRTASALGIDAILLSGDSCDPWYRRSIRTSMGHIFRIPVITCKYLDRSLKLLHEEVC